MNLRGGRPAMYVVAAGDTTSGPGTLSAGPGEACGYLDWCVDGYHCQNNICVRDCADGFTSQNGACISTGEGGGVGQRVHVAVSNIVCPGPNMRLWDSRCICEDDFTKDPNGPGCVPLGVPGTYVPGSQEFREDCMEIGGEIDPTTGACLSPGGLYYQGSWRFTEDCLNGGGEIDPNTGACRAKTVMASSTTPDEGGKPDSWDQDVQFKKKSGTSSGNGAGATTSGGGGMTQDPDAPAAEVPAPAVETKSNLPWIIGCVLVAAVAAVAAVAVIASNKKEKSSK